MRYGRLVGLSALCLLAMPGTRSAAGLSLTYQCFFEGGSAALSDRCRGIIGEAAGYWHQMARGEMVPWPSVVGAPPLPARVLHVEVRGYAGDLGDAGRNDRLSMLRALAVTSELQRLGVPEASIVPIGFGATDPLIPHAPLDPQNRRAWIVMR